MASTKLDLINDVLERIGKLPVQHGNTVLGQNSLSGLVERMIDSADRELQARGWHFNSKRNVQLTAGSDGRIAISTIEGSREIFQIDSDAEDAHIDVVRQDSVLFNLTDNTDQISSLKVQYTYKVDLTWMQEMIQSYQSHSGTGLLPRLLVDLIGRTTKRTA